MTPTTSWQGKGQLILQGSFLGGKQLLKVSTRFSKVLFYNHTVHPPMCVDLPPAPWPPLHCRYVTGWFSPYHRRRKLIHPVMIEHIQPQALR